MHVAVIGAGVTGITSAYYLSANGHDVTVIDRAAEVAAETSHANGGQLSYSYTDAFARPSLLPTIPGLLLGLDPAIRVQLLSRPSLFGWGLRFLRQCTRARARNNTLTVLDLALRSAVQMAAICADTGVDFSFSAGGKLILMPASANLAATRASIALKKKHGVSTTLLSMTEAIALEPALASLTGRYAGAVFSAHDEVGDARLFTAGLAAWLTQRAVNLRLATDVHCIVRESGKLRGLETDKGDVPADAVVVCAGSDSPRLLRPLGIAAPIYPVRGYSITLPPGRTVPAISVTDLAQRILYCPLGGRMRISGFADFVGADTHRDANRIRHLSERAARAAPEFADYSVTECSPWAGSRPMTPDGRPMTGATRVPGVYLNCGHGALGWTLAAATAQDVARAVLQNRAGRSGKQGG